jgi:hypothetical protein
MKLLTRPTCCAPAHFEVRVATATESRMRQRMNMAKQLVQAGLCRFKIICRLQIEPVLRRLFKGAPEQQRQFSRHRAC